MTVLLVLFCVFLSSIHISKGQSYACKFDVNGVLLDLSPLLGLKLTAVEANFSTYSIQYTPCSNGIYCIYYNQASRVYSSNLGCVSVISYFDSNVYPTYNEITETWTFYYMGSSNFQVNYVCDPNAGLYSKTFATYSSITYRYIFNITTSLACTMDYNSSTTPMPTTNGTYDNYIGYIYPYGDNSNKSPIFVQISNFNVAFFSQNYGDWMLYSIYKNLDGRDYIGHVYSSTNDSEIVGDVIIKPNHEILTGIYLDNYNKVYQIEANA